MILYPVVWNSTGGGGGGASDSFTTFQTDTGTSPVADGPTDTLTFTTDDVSSYYFDGDATTDSISLIIEDATFSLRGLVNTTSQTFSGDKEFNNAIQDITSSFNGIFSNLSINNTAPNNNNAFGIFSNVVKTDNFTDNSTYFGIVGQAVMGGGGDATRYVGVQASARLESIATSGMSNASAIDAYIYNGSTETIAFAPVIQASIQNSGGGSITDGIGVNISALSGDTSITGFRFYSGGSDSTAQLYGIDINLSSASSSRPIALNINGGSISANGQYTTSSSLFVENLNQVTSELSIASGSPLTGTDVFGFNLPMLLLADDDVALGPIGLGLVSVGFVSQLSVASTKTVDKTVGALGGFSIGAPSLGGTITNAVCFEAFGIVDLGAGGTLTTVNEYGFKVGPNIGSTSPTNAYGFYNDIAGTKNFLNRLSIFEEDTMTVNGSLIDSKLAVHADDGVTIANIELHKHTATAAAGSQIYGARSRGTGASPSVVQADDILLQVSAVGYDGTDYATSAQISFEVAGTPGSNDMPGRIVFKTSADGSQTLTERFLVDTNSVKSTYQFYTGVATLSDGANISWDLSGASAQCASVTLAGNRTLDNPTNMKAGAMYILKVIQDSTGGRTLSWGSSYKFTDGVDPILSAGANAVDVFYFFSDGTNMYGTPVGFNFG